jgi:hypothetical protein
LSGGLYNLLKYNYHLLRSPPGDPRVTHCSHFSVPILPPISFFPRLPESAPGAHRGVVTRHAGRIRIFFAPYEAWIPAICLISERKTTKKTILLCPPSLILAPNSDPPVIQLKGMLCCASRCLRELPLSWISRAHGNSEFC